MGEESKHNAKAALVYRDASDDEDDSSQDDGDHDMQAGN